MNFQPARRREEAQRWLTALCAGGIRFALPETECRPTPQMEIQTSHSLNYDGVRLVAADNSFPDLNGIVAGITTLGIAIILFEWYSYQAYYPLNRDNSILNSIATRLTTP